MAAPKDDKAVRPIIIVKRKKDGGGGHHGGAWKVAYADFVTAMMAFFMVMWLVTAVSKDQRAAIFDYFKNPSMEDGKAPKPAPGQAGPGGASTAVINMGGGLDAMRQSAADNKGLGAREDKGKAKNPELGVPRPPVPTSDDEVRKKAVELEQKRLQKLKEQLEQAIQASQALAPFKNQLLLDITQEGLRIQIVDAQNRPMFDIGSATLKSYTVAILKELTTYLNNVENKLSITGHTDETPYVAKNGYNNWDLSADRANAARRALEMGGLNPDKVSRVVGLSSSVLFDREQPRNPINRRISIIVMTRDAEESARRTDEVTEHSTAAGADGAPAAAGPAPAPELAGALPAT